jgi:hypothetical protein
LAQRAAGVEGRKILRQMPESAKNTLEGTAGASSDF